MDVYLCALYNFHVEVFRERNEQLFYIRSSEKPEMLDIYLDMICIEEIRGM